MISNPTPKFTSQIRSIRSVFGRNRTGTGSEKIDRIDRNRISGRTLDISDNVLGVPGLEFGVPGLDALDLLVVPDFELLDVSEEAELVEKAILLITAPDG